MGMPSAGSNRRDKARLIVISLALALAVLPSSSVQSQQGRARGVPDAPSARVLPNLGGRRPIDGIDVARQDGFWNRWQLVTVRFRKDNGEQRFIYANPAAWNAMRKGRSSYPDNAMFAKVAFAVTEDAAFPNSVEPRGVTRVQLMRKDAKAYKDTDGWGYALIAGGAPTQTSDREAAGACHACHRLVPERDFVFSSASFARAAPVRAASLDFKARFHDRPVANLTAFERRALSHVLRNESVENLGTIRSATMSLFEGSVNESAGVLSNYATAEGKLYALWDPEHEQFAIARPLAPSPQCKAQSLMALTVGSQRSPGPRHIRERVGIMCDGVWLRTRPTAVPTALPNR